MIDKFSLKAAKSLATYDRMPEIDVMKYSIKIIFTNGFTLLLMVACGLTFGNLEDVFAAAISFSLLRSFSGGYHIKSSEMCIIISTLIIVLISNYAYTMSEYNTLLFVITLLLVLLFSPAKIKHHSILKEKYYIIFKILSVIIVIVAYLTKNDVIQTSTFVQSLTLIHLRGGEMDE